MIKIAPSILSCDFSKLGEEIRKLEQAGADYIHIDVMDGHFVPNITLGSPVVAKLRKETELPFDVHLMVDNPDTQIEAFSKAGADIINVHYEVCPHLHRTLQKIKSLGKKAGVTINPATSPKLLYPILHMVDLVLVMSVNPGYGGQKFIPSTLESIRILEKYKKSNNFKYEIEIDGGISDKNSKKVIEAGVDVIVSGSAIFKADNMADMIKRLRQ